MSRKLEIRDPVYASYLIQKGCKLLGIEPYVKPKSPKKYIFSDSAKDEPHEAFFLGSIAARERTTWLNFKNAMENLLDKEGHLLRQFSDRPEKTGVETWHRKNKTIFQTSNQVVAAFMFSKELTVNSIFGLGENRGYLYTFSDYKKAYDFYDEMISGEAEDTWWNMKCWYKLATEIRKHMIDHRPKKKVIEPVIEVSAAEG